MLIDKSYKQYSYISRYNVVPYYYNTQDKKYIYGITSYLDDTTPYTLHTVVRGETIDNLALKFYGNPTLFWILCSFNRITNPYKTLNEGEQIKIPSISTIKFDRKGRG